LAHRRAIRNDAQVDGRSPGDAKFCGFAANSTSSRGLLDHAAGLCHFAIKQLDRAVEISGCSISLAH